MNTTKVAIFLSERQGKAVYRESFFDEGLACKAAADRLSAYRAQLGPNQPIRVEITGEAAAEVMEGSRPHVLPIQPLRK